MLLHQRQEGESGQELSADLLGVGPRREIRTLCMPFNRMLGSAQYHHFGRAQVVELYVGVALFAPRTWLVVVGQLEMD